MPIAIILVLIDVSLVVHAAKTGRFWPWAYVILLLPGVGAVAYVLIELLPEWFGSAQGQKARQRVINTLDPEKQYRRFADELSITDTIANRVDLAEECLLLGKFEEALAHYENALSRPLGDEPAYAIGKARAPEAPAGCGRDARPVARALARVSVGGWASPLRAGTGRERA